MHLKLLSSHEIDLEYANCLTVVRSTGEVVIHGVVAGEEDRNRKYAFHVYRRTDDGLRFRSIVPTCQDDAVEILPIRKGWCHFVSCIKFAFLPTVWYDGKVTFPECTKFKDVVIVVVAVAENKVP